MKSVTPSARIRSARLPSAPPASSPTPSQRPGRVESSANQPTHQRQASDRDREHQRVAAIVEQPEGDAAVGDPGEVEAERQVDPLAGSSDLDDRALRDLVDGDDQPADGEHPQPGAASRRAHPRIRFTITPPRIETVRIATIGLMSSGPIRGMKRRKTFRNGLGALLDEPDHRPQREVVGQRPELLDPGEQHVGDDQDRVDEQQRGDVVGDVAAGEREREHQPRIRFSEARTAALNASAAPRSASAPSPASVLPPGDATVRRTSIGS